MGAADTTSQMYKLFRNILLSSVTTELSGKVTMAAVNDRKKREIREDSPGSVKYHAIHRGVVGGPTNRRQAAPCEQ